MDDGKQGIALAALARLIGISDRRAREQAAAGVFVRAGKRGFDRDASVRAYGATLRKAATGRRGEGKSTASEERARLARLQGDALELRNKIARKELIGEAEVEARWSEIVRLTRDAILAAPARSTVRLNALLSNSEGASFSGKTTVPGFQLACNSVGRPG
jgi:phage terminase Nu1 subunit (DNA packaging protein)